MALFYLFLIIIWQTVFERKWYPSYILPSPFEVAGRLWELFISGDLWRAIMATLSRVCLGFSLAVLLGLIFGLSMGVNKTANECLKSFFLGLQTLPTVAWVPIALMIFGIRSDTAIYFVVVMSSMPAVSIATADSIANIPPLYLRAARTLGTTPWAMGWRVIFPCALPGIVTGIKLGWTLAWHGGVSGELVKMTLGLGSLLHAGRENSDPAQVIGIMVVTILFGLMLDRFLFGTIEHRIRARWGLTSSH